MATQLNPIDELLPIIASAVANWKLENSKEKIAANVTRLLNANSEEVTMKLLGFNNNWNKDWQLDHCNGRAGNSIAGDFLKNAQLEAIKQWLTTVALPELSDKTKAKLKKEMQSEYDFAISNLIRERVRAKANGDIDAIANSLVKSTQVDNYIKAMKLINNET